MHAWGVISHLVIIVTWCWLGGDLVAVLWSDSVDTQIYVCVLSLKNHRPNSMLTVVRDACSRHSMWWISGGPPGNDSRNCFQSIVEEASENDTYLHGGQCFDRCSCATGISHFTRISLVVVHFGQGLQKTSCP